MFLEIKSENLVGLLPADILDADLAAATREHDLSVLNSGKTETREVIVKFANQNQSRTFSATKSPVFDGDGEIHGLGTSVTEITIKVKFEDDLMKSNILFR